MQEFRLKPLLVGLGVSITTFLILLLIITGIFASVDISHSAQIIISFVVPIASVFTGSYYTGRKAGRAGWRYGVMIAAVLILLGLAAGLATHSGQFTGWFLGRSMAILICGFLSGTWGTIKSNKNGFRGF